MKGTTVVVVLLAAAAVAGGYYMTRKKDAPAVIVAPAYEAPPENMTGVDHTPPPPDKVDPEAMLLQFGTKFLGGLATSAGQQAGSAFGDGTFDFDFFG